MRPEAKVDQRLAGDVLLPGLERRQRVLIHLLALCRESAQPVLELHINLVELRALLAVRRPKDLGPVLLAPGRRHQVRHRRRSERHDQRLPGRNLLWRGEDALPSPSRPPGAQRGGPRKGGEGGVLGVRLHLAHLLVARGHDVDEARDRVDHHRVLFRDSKRLPRMRQRLVADDQHVRRRLNASHRLQQEVLRLRVLHEALLVGGRGVVDVEGALDERAQYHPILERLLVVLRVHARLDADVDVRLAVEDGLEEGALGELHLELHAAGKVPVRVRPRQLQPLLVEGVRARHPRVGRDQGDACCVVDGDGA
mmetsp:Transcript_24160/g.71323  ORF Transcript_24160/g.71323 Transcript_24160/m.71323 type:complete len:310 (-) Transcript_24160:23-952(-)